MVNRISHRTSGKSRSFNELDPGFGEGGILRYNAPDSLRTVFSLLEPGEKILALVSALRSSSFDSYGLARFDAEGRPDISFGDGGSAVYRFGISFKDIDMVHLQSGSTVIAGSAVLDTGEGVGVARLLAGGQLDRSFGVEGQVELGGPVDTHIARLRKVFELPDEKILVAGQYFDFDDENREHDFFARLTPSGSLDTTFGKGGYTVLPHRGRLGSGLMTKAGRIVLTGYQLLRGRLEFERIGYVRAYNADTSLDVSFGTRGEVAITRSGYHVEIDGLVERGDDQGMYLIGTTRPIGEIVSSETVVLSLKADGSLDESFNGGEMRYFAKSRSPDAMTVDSQGRLIIAGTADNDGVFVGRLRRDGQVDTSFGDGMGSVEHHTGTTVGGQVRVALMDDARMLVSYFQQPYACVACFAV